MDGVQVQVTVVALLTTVEWRYAHVECNEDKEERVGKEMRRGTGIAWVKLQHEQDKGRYRGVGVHIKSRVREQFVTINKRSGRLVGRIGRDISQ